MCEDSELLRRSVIEMEMLRAQVDRLTAELEAARRRPGADWELRERGVWYEV
jgi:hypothetical protein